MNRIAEGHFVSPQDLIKDLKRFHPKKNRENGSLFRTALSIEVKLQM